MQSSHYDDDDDSATHLDDDEAPPPPPKKQQKLKVWAWQGDDCTKLGQFDDIALARECAKKAVERGYECASIVQKGHERMDMFATDAPLHTRFLDACREGQIDTVRELLSRIDPSDDKIAMSSASYNGHADVVALLLADSRVDPSHYGNGAIIYASENGHADVVALLLADPRVDPSGSDNDAIRRASENGHADVVALLLADSRVDPYHNAAIIEASINDHTRIVEMLLPHVDPIAVIHVLTRQRFD